MFQIMYSSGKVKGHLYWPRKVISLKSTKPLLKMDLWIILLRLFASNMGVNISPLLTYIPVLLKILVFKTTPLGSNWYLPMLYINTFANKRTIKLQISSICAWKSWNVSLMDSPQIFDFLEPITQGTLFHDEQHSSIEAQMFAARTPDPAAARPVTNPDCDRSEWSRSIKPQQC